jgi:hypothetical protein
LGFPRVTAEDAPGQANDAFIIADADAELDDEALWIPPGVRWKTEKHEIPPARRQPKRFA